ncbi:MAG TPA: glycerophosphodiester phosphodiesterase [Solirubrobacteraceae bacterium]|nr:glycerophosphodiester phosphodiesterase [Solirubrobacteraceae bacterium]
MRHAAVRPGDDLAALADRLDAGRWEMVELDVLAADGRLLVAHDAQDLTHPGALSFVDALSALRDQLPERLELDIDLKATGFELEALEAVRECGLVGRSLFSSMHTSSLRVLRSAQPELRLGLSVPRARRDHLSHPATRPLALVGLAALRRTLPRRAAAAVRSGLADAIMAHWATVTPALVAAVQAHGGELYAWTVDDPDRARRLAALGVNGVIANDTAAFAQIGDTAHR